MEGQVEDHPEVRPVTGDRGLRRGAGVRGDLVGLVWDCSERRYWPEQSRLEKGAGVSETCVITKLFTCIFSLNPHTNLYEGESLIILILHLKSLRSMELKECA